MHILPLINNLLNKNIFVKEPEASAEPSREVVADVGKIAVDQLSIYICMTKNKQK